MQYALLIYTAPGTAEALSPAEQQALSAEYYALRDEPGMLGGRASNRARAPLPAAAGSGMLTSRPQVPRGGGTDRRGERRQLRRVQPPALPVQRDVDHVVR
jgi:hypothetical protein